MEQQIALSKISRTWSALGALSRSHTVVFILQILLAKAHAQNFSWELRYVDAFNAAVTATVQTEPPNATCGYPGAGNTFAGSCWPVCEHCSNTCNPLQSYHNKRSRLSEHTSQYMDKFRNMSFWQQTCSPELDSVHRRKRNYVNDGRGKRRADAEMCFRYGEADVGPFYPRETHVMRIRHAHDIFEGVVLDVQKDVGPDRLSLSLRVTGSDLKLTYDNRVRVYHNPEPPNTWTHIAIQHDTSLGVDGQSLFVNGLYLTPFEVTNERRGNPSVWSGWRAYMKGVHLSFGVVGDPGIPLLDNMIEFLTIQECKDIHYSAMVTVAHDRHGMVSTQRSIATNIFSRGRETSVYNCPHDEARLTKFACAFYLPAVHTSPNGDVMTYYPCKRLCEEIKAACGATLDAVPLLGKLSCEAYHKKRCVDTDYVPYMGFYNGTIADYRYYNDILTNREIHALVTGELAQVPPFTPVDFSECLCPPKYPAIYASSPHLCVTNRVNDDHLDISRGQAHAHVRYRGETLRAPEMATDLDPHTAWVSAQGIEHVSLLLFFHEIYQVLGVTFFLNSTFPGTPSATDDKSVEIALLSVDDMWRTVYYIDQSCDDDRSGIRFEGSKYQPSQVVCVSPSVTNPSNFFQFTVDFLWGKKDYMTETSVHPRLLNILNGRGLRLRLNERRSHIVSELKVHARVYPQHTLCGCYKAGTDVRGKCSHSGQCPCRNHNGDPQHGGLKCEPYVMSVLPTYGPVSGGTNITIMGGYFGEYSPGPDEWYDASNDIYIVFGNSGVTCGSIRAKQMSIECLTTSVNNTSEFINTPLKLTVQFSSGFQLMADSLVFTYTPDPVIYTIQPLNSFLSGGIIQTVVGINFDLVAKRFMTLTVIVNGNTPSSQPSPELCTVLNNTLMHCPSPTVDLRTINTFSRSDVETVPVHDDVTIERAPVHYDVTMEIGPDHDDVTMQMVPLYDNDTFPNKRVTEESEASKKNDASINSQGMHDFEIGFILDGVSTYHNVTMILGPEKGKMMMHYDPDFERWRPEILIFRPYDNDKFITIRGFRMDYGAQLSDYRVSISSEQCEVVQLDMKTLICRPPVHTPKPDVFFRDGAHRVLLEVGKLTIHVGYLKYYRWRWDDPSFQKASIAIAVGIGVVVVALALLIAYLVVRRVYEYPIARIRARRNKIKTAELNYQKRPRKLMDMLDADLKAQIKECLIKPHTRLTLGHELGKGNFGKVYSGQLQMPRPQLPCACAVKTLKDDSNDVKELREFLEEATIMKDFNHANVLTLVGVVIMNNRPHVLLPLMVHGDLKGYVSNPHNTFSIGELLDFGLQVAKGMVYLSSKKFVHRDLAARNCMVDDKKVVKIADFGLARDIYERDYYAVEDRRRPMPIKWMAPECLETSKFDSRSDVGHCFNAERPIMCFIFNSSIDLFGSVKRCDLLEYLSIRQTSLASGVRLEAIEEHDEGPTAWSYGVTLWESLTRGCKPYSGIDNLDVKRFLMRGGRLEKPTYCPADIYALMKDCWNLDPHSRPIFPLIATRISDSLEAGRQMETPSKEAMSHDYLEMVNQAGYVPLETAVPSDRAPGNDNELQSMTNSKRYTREPHPEPKYKNGADAATPSEDALDVSSPDDYLVPTGSGVKPGLSRSNDKHLASTQVSLELHGDDMDSQL